MGGGIGITDIPDSRTRVPSGEGLGAGKKIILGYLIVEQGGQWPRSSSFEIKQTIYLCRQKDVCLPDMHNRVGHTLVKCVFALEPHFYYVKCNS